MNARKKNVLLCGFAMLLLINICATVFLGIRFFKNENKAHETMYTLYIGLNDKDTNLQEIPDSEAKTIVKNICTQYADGFTMQDASGEWTNEKGEKISEKTIVCIFYGVEEETIHRIAAELRLQLNQSSILIEKVEISTEYYTGDAISGK